MKLVKTYDMWGQNESLDELVNLEGKKSQKNTFKIWPIFIILNLDITNLNRSRGYTKDPNSGKKSIAKANFFFEKNCEAKAKQTPKLFLRTNNVILLKKRINLPFELVVKINNF